MPAASTATESILLLHVTGEDHPGISATLSQILADHHVEILDLNQTVIHSTLLLGLLVRIPPTTESASVLKDLLFSAHHAGLTLRITPVDDAQYDAWVARQGQPRHILTLLARRLTAGHLAAVSRLLADQGLNIDVITRLSGRPPRIDDGKPRRACVELSIRGVPADEDVLRAALMQITHVHPIDLAWQRDDIYRRTRRLVAFDMDSTLIRHEVIDELAREAGVFEKVSAITEAAMRGDLDFNQSLLQRVSLLKGLPVSTLQRVADRLDLTEGTDRLLPALKSFGYKTAIISGGFQFFARHFQQKLQIDHVRANDLEIEGGLLTGRVIGEIVNAQRKADLLQQIAAEERISLQQTIAVGDGANDLPMLAAAGLGIAFHAKPLVAKSAKHKISTLGLDSLLYLIGVRDRDLLP
ncbi:MAG TPA: phosphoserine phosphatase SerB [Tepidisphaeraceae bacterium]|jgi:phosphoserine phosphatase|nr:phosphoserine phosphatase SerB [Tepidisphaeraceae bacterium]